MSFFYCLMLFNKTRFIYCLEMNGVFNIFVVYWCHIRLVSLIVEKLMGFLMLSSFIHQSDKEFKRLSDQNLGFSRVTAFILKEKRQDSHVYCLKILGVFLMSSTKPQ